MVDVVLVILIFFMAGSAFLGQEWFLKSEVLRRGTPTTKADPLALPPTRLILTLEPDQAGHTTINGMGDPLDLQGFATALKKFTDGVDVKQIIVIVAPAANVPYQDVFKVHEICSAAGIERIGVSDK